MKLSWQNDVNWIIPASTYSVWPDFSIEVSQEIIFKAGQSYQLIGDNGTGKSSFLKKILICHLQSNPEAQYILYTEQQVRSQFDAIKANGALQKPPVNIFDFKDMIRYQFELLRKARESVNKPGFIILDECSYINEASGYINNFKLNDACIVFVSHQDVEASFTAKQHLIKFNRISEKLSSI